MPDEPAAGDVARQEAARQTVILLFSLAAAACVVLMQRHVSDPDFLRTVSMRVSKRMERFHAKLAAWSWRTAENYRRSYEAERP